jgi:hypothetical protein
MPKKIRAKYGQSWTAFGGLKLSPPIIRYISLPSLVEAKRTPGITVSWSPFGWVDEGGTAFVKGAPPIRGKGRDEIAAMGDMGKAIDRGLGKAIELSKAHREKGVALVTIRKRVKRMPAKAAAMMQAGRRKELVTLVTTLV